MEYVAYERARLPQLADLARLHARLAPPYLSLTDEEVDRGLQVHAAWPFYSRGLEASQTLLAMRDDQVLAAAQFGPVQHGWGYGALEGDGPEWLFQPHISLFWMFAWPGWSEAQAAGATLVAAIVGRARAQGLPGLEAFRGGPGFMPFGTQLSSYWPHLYQPLRAGGFRQPRDLAVYTGVTDAAALPALDVLPEGLRFRARRGRIEAWVDDAPVGQCTATTLAPGWADEPGAGLPGGNRGAHYRDPKAREWAIIRRLIVDGRWRSMGIGSALLAEQLRRLSASGVKRYLLHMPDDADELPAHALYQKFGRLLDRQHVLRVSF